MADTPVVTCATPATLSLGVSTSVGQQITPSATVNVDKIQITLFDTPSGAETWNIGIASDTVFNWIGFASLLLSTNGVKIVTLATRIVLTASTSYYVVCNCTSGIGEIGLGNAPPTVTGGTSSGCRRGSGTTLGTVVSGFAMPFVLYEAAAAPTFVPQVIVI